MEYIITIDEGTTSVRAILYNIQKKCFEKIERKPIKQIFPKPLWVEHNAEEIYKNIEECIKKVCKKIDLKNIKGIGITNQRETIVAWDSKTGKPLYNAIVWQCRRTADYCEKLKLDEFAKIIQEKTGLIPNSYFSATKIKWLLENNKEVQKALKDNRLKIGTMETFLIYRLTKGKEFVSDVTNACRTMLFNIKTLNWDEELLNYFNIPKNILADRIINNDEIVGKAKINNAEIDIVGVIGDQQSSLFGQGCFEKGMTKNTYGTGCFMLTNIGKNIIESKKGLLTTISFKTKNNFCYALEGSVFNAGSTIEWAIQNLNLATSPQELSKLAYSIKDNEGVYLVPAFSGLGTPYWDMNARALLCGMTRKTDKRNICRAVLESMAFCTYDVLKSMEEETNIKIKELHVDGGVSKNDNLMQFQCDLLQTNLLKFNDESTCLGSIFMSCLGLGVYKSFDDIKKVLKPIKSFKVKDNKNNIKNIIDDWHNAVKKCLEVNK